MFQPFKFGDGLLWCHLKALLMNSAVINSPAKMTDADVEANYGEPVHFGNIAPMPATKEATMVTR